jgi:hemerythrin-like domain-containing protein
MKRIADALELLTAQHDEITLLLTLLQHEADRVRVLGEIADRLATHFVCERDLLEHLNIDEVGDDHDRLQAALEAVFQTEIDAVEMPARIAAFGHIFARHVRWQEDVVFVMLAETVSPDVLERIGTRLAKWSETSFVVAA